MKLPDEPVWRTPAGPLRAHLPQGLREWLLPTSSLTHRLERVCGTGFAVRVLTQGWAPVLVDEARALGLGPGRRAFVRQVQLLCNGTPWVFGRTVIPARALHGGPRRLTQLGNTPLGAVLFADPSLRRDSVELARINPPHRLFKHVLGGTAPGAPALWGRRSRYRIGGKALLVTEVFLHGTLLPAPVEPLSRTLSRRNGNHHAH
ncbi:MAG: chorismate--pyruvate lyase family protein [Gammaproteobacteria bacterium]